MFYNMILLRMIVVCGINFIVDSYRFLVIFWYKWWKLLFKVYY